jgi:hypothetical protein
MKKIIIPLLFLFITSLFFYPVFIKGDVPIPADTIIGLYHPYRDLYSEQFPNGAPFKNFLITDPVRQQYPWRELSVSLQKNGDFPLWNPYTFSGTPLLANFQTAVYYPFNFLFFILPFSVSWSILIYLQPLLAGLFLYIYLRHLRLTQSASFLGSIAFAFSGFMTAWLEWGTLGHTALWLPLMLLSIDKLLVSSTTRVKKKNAPQQKKRNSFIAKIISNKILLWSLTFLVSLCASLFAGHVQTFVYVCLFALSYLVARWLQYGKNKKHIFLFTGLFFAAALITFVQWFPTLNFILQSARDIDQMDSWKQPGWFIPWQHLIQFVAPDFFGNPTTLNYWGEWNYGEFIGYVGLLPLIMAVYALYSRKDKKTLFFGLLFLVAILFSLPTFLAQIPYVTNIPFFSSTQPTRLLIIADLCLAILAALGMDRFIRGGGRNKIFYSLGLFTVTFGSLWIYTLFGVSAGDGVTSANLEVAKRNLLLPSALYICITLLLIILLFEKKMKKKYFIHVIVGCLLTITLIDLFRFSHKFNTFTDPAFIFPQTKTITYLQEQQGQFRIMTTASELLPPNFSVIYRIQSIEGYDPLYLLRYGEFMAALKRNKPDISAPFGFNRIITPQNVKSPLVDLVGVKYIMSLSELREEGLEKKMVEGKTILYENKNVFPRAFLVENVIPVQSKEEAMQALYSPKTNLRLNAIVENWDNETNSFGKGSVKVLEYTENHVIIRSENKDQGYLVLMDTNYPTWNAEICSEFGENCQMTKIYNTNYVFRGVIVPEGKHIVRFYITLL